MFLSPAALQFCESPFSGFKSKHDQSIGRLLNLKQPFWGCMKLPFLRSKFEGMMQKCCE
jgi:hypothetical protein